MKVYVVSDRYINYIRERFPNVMDPKVGRRSHSRKYIGVVLLIGPHHYFAPLSSPKPRDYLPNGLIRKPTSLCVPMTANSNGKQILLGTIKLNDMIPVPSSEVTLYDLALEPDKNYAELVRNEIRFIGKNQGLIAKKARRLYFAKLHEGTNKNGQNEKWFRTILLFPELEETCDAFGTSSADDEY